MGRSRSWHPNRYIISRLYGRSRLALTSFVSQRLLDAAEAADDVTTEKQEEQTTVTKTRVLADGTYATETVYTSAAAQARLEQVKAATKPPLRALILGGDFYTSSVLASTLTKLTLRYAKLANDAQAVNALKAEVSLVHVDDSSIRNTDRCVAKAMLIMTSIVRVGQSHFAAIPIDEDSRERIMNCIETLANLKTAQAASDIFLQDTRAAYTKMVANEEVCSHPLFVLEVLHLCSRINRKRLVRRRRRTTRRLSFRPMT